MPWLAAIATVVSAGAGIYSTVSASQQAKKAEKANDAAMPQIQDLPKSPAAAATQQQAVEEEKKRRIAKTVSRSKSILTSESTLGEANVMRKTLLGE